MVEWRNWCHPNKEGKEDLGEVTRTSDIMIRVYVDHVVRDYALQVVCNDEEKEDYWWKLDDVVSAVLQNVRISIRGNLNGHVGRERIFIGWRRKQEWRRECRWCWYCLWHCDKHAFQEKGKTINMLNTFVEAREPVELPVVQKELCQRLKTVRWSEGKVELFNTS